MSRGMLSQAEVETLLAQESGEKPPASLPDAPTTAAPSRQLLGPFAERFAAGLAAAFSKLLRTTVLVRPRGIDNGFGHTFVAGLSEPTFLSVLKAAWFEGEMLLEIEPSALFPILDRLLGGPPASGVTNERPLTEIDLRLAARVRELVLSALRTASGLEELCDFELIKVESEARKVRLAAPDDVLTVLRFELVLHHAARGMINVALPSSIVDRILLDAVVATAGDAPAEAESAAVEITTRLATLTISSTELADLREGDIIATDEQADSPATLYVDGKPAFLARPGVYQGRKAIRIESAIDRPPPDVQ